MVRRRYPTLPAVPDTRRPARTVVRRPRARPDTARPVGRVALVVPALPVVPAMAVRLPHPAGVFLVSRRPARPLAVLVTRVAPVDTQVLAVPDPVDLAVRRLRLLPRRVGVRLRSRPAPVRRIRRRTRRKVSRPGGAARTARTTGRPGCGRCPAEVRRSRHGSAATRRRSRRLRPVDLVCRPLCRRPCHRVLPGRLRARCGVRRSRRLRHPADTRRPTMTTSSTPRSSRRRCVRRSTARVARSTAAVTILEA